MLCITGTALLRCCITVLFLIIRYLEQHLNQLHTFARNGIYKYNVIQLCFLIFTDRKAGAFQVHPSLMLKEGVLSSNCNSSIIAGVCTSAKLGTVLQKIEYLFIH